ncbi:MAG: carbohydrate-binding protein [Planctomycetota bacterium]|nr:MAG: carbohydrate-binding protein [Planctomycetota bacterium]
MESWRGGMLVAGLWAALCGVAPADADTLVWSDEFDGTSVNPANWEFMIGDGSDYGIPGWGNNELQYYTARPENAVVSNGTLKIIARQENYGGRNYTSARLRTMNRAEFQYGRMEARIKLPSTQGIWPAFWMLPTNSPYGGWAASGEIDIMESVNIATTIYGSIHFGGQWPNNTHLTCTRSNGTNYSLDFHTFSLEWTPTYLRWYVDDVAYCTRGSNQWYSDAAPGDDNAPFDHPFHFLLNVAVGGNFPGSPNGSSVFPQVMEVDWVRVYQDVASQEPYGGTPWPIPGQIEAEDYDDGGPALAYFDCDPSNNGGAYRPSEEVDVQAAGEGGFNIGWMCANEWTEYTVNVEAAGVYLVEARVASQSTGGSFHLAFDGINKTGMVTVPVTGGWQNWTTVNATASLDEGVQVMRLSNSGTAQEYNVSWFRFTLQCVKGDMNDDGLLDGADIAGFTETLLSPASVGARSQCAADVDTVPGADMSDLPVFVDILLAGETP